MSETKRGLGRRGALIGLGVSAVGVAGALALRPGDRGGAHDEYFLALTQALRDAGLAHPTLVIDRARMLANADVAKATLAASGLPVRVVVKSLPAFGLIDPIAARLETNRFMVFNGSMLHQMLTQRSDSDLLLGKPLPEVEAAPLIRPAADGMRGPQWLIDTAERLGAYIAIARANNARLRINFEIDVGLHRGGFRDPDALGAAIEMARAEPLVEICGLMGYDPHVVKAPDVDAAFRRSQETYRAAADRLTQTLGVGRDALTLNGAGSPSYKLHATGSVANEVAIGSGFVKPLDFDIDTLAHHQPAAFIATPVIKALDSAELPVLDDLSSAISMWDRNSERAFFIYGGHWMARPVSPPGLQFSSIFGRSSNQELLTGSRRVTLAVNDYVFFRPTQSEAVFLQFGPIAIYDEGRIVEMAETFPVSA